MNSEKISRSSKTVKEGELGLVKVEEGSQVRQKRVIEFVYNDDTIGSELLQRYSIATEPLRAFVEGILNRINNYQINLRGVKILSIYQLQDKNIVS